MLYILSTEIGKPDVEKPHGNAYVRPMFFVYYLNSKKDTFINQEQKSTVFK
jgi:hypothetical protein